MKKILIVTIFMLSGCSGGSGSFCEFNNYQGAICEGARQKAIQAQQSSMQNELSTIIDECNDKLKRKVYKKKSIMLRECQKPRVLNFAERTNPSQVEGINADMSKQIMLVEMVEQKKITQAQADDFMAQYYLQDSVHRNQNNAARMHSAAEAQLNNAIIQSQQQEQFRKNTQPYYVVPNRNRITCNGNSYGNTTSVSCY